MYIHADTKTIYMYMCVCVYKYFFQITFYIRTYPSKHYLIKVKIRNTRKSREICSKLTIKTPE